MPNRLADASSPYLQQHAHHPVDWRPWGEEALDLARQRDLPILLSIGYSACHWCHVMAHESFENAEIAELMNRHFISIKVDREERPDLDHIYQSAHALLSRHSGGWPLTVFLTPAQEPFFAGTYFPPSSRLGLPGFGDVLRQLAYAWQEQRSDLEAHGGTITTLLARMDPAAAPAPLNGASADALEWYLAQTFDRVWGGFGRAPKFPSPQELAFLLRRGPSARHMALTTLAKMAGGGLFDQVGGGFFRYSVDERWEIPHFEKMLYDNGQLLALYSDAAVLTGEPGWGRVAEETATWLLDVMRPADGLFCSSLDADSDGGEGRAYLWQRNELKSVLNRVEYALLAQHFGLDKAPNFEGAWHLRPSHDTETTLRPPGFSDKKLASQWRALRTKLAAIRATRPQPARDDKNLTGWNALAIRGLFRAARALDRPDWAEAGRTALDVVRRDLWRDGALLASARDGRGQLNAYLDDHAFLLDALLESLCSTFRREDLDFAVALAESLIARFADPEGGGFFFTSHDHERLIHRPKLAWDNATPSGNGVAARALHRLGLILGETRYLDASRSAVQAFANEMRQTPAACPGLWMAHEEQCAPCAVVILRGEASALKAWQARLNRIWLPAALVLPIPDGTPGVPPALDRPGTGPACAWLCREDTGCAPVITSLEVLEAALGA